MCEWNIEGKNNFFKMIVMGYWGPASFAPELNICEQCCRVLGNTCPPPEDQEHGRNSKTPAGNGRIREQLAAVNDNNGTFISLGEAQWRPGCGLLQT